MDGHSHGQTGIRALQPGLPQDSQRSLPAVWRYLHAVRRRIHPPSCLSGKTLTRADRLDQIGNHSIVRARGYRNAAFRSSLTGPAATTDSMIAPASVRPASATARAARSMFHNVIPPIADAVKKASVSFRSGPCGNRHAAGCPYPRPRCTIQNHQGHPDQKCDEQRAKVVEPVGFSNNITKLQVAAGDGEKIADSPAGKKQMKIISVAKTNALWRLTSARRETSRSTAEPDSQHLDP